MILIRPAHRVSYLPDSLTKEEDDWVLSVTDFGAAVEEGELDKVCLKGYRGIHAKKRKATAAEGTGLGMYLVERVCRALGGSVSIKCEKPKWSSESYELGWVTVTLRFPAAGKES